MLSFISWVYLVTSGMRWNTNGVVILGFYETWAQIKLVPLKNTLWKLLPLQNVLGKFTRNFSNRLVLKNNDQRKAAVDSKPMSLSWMRWQSQADIAGEQAISLAIVILLINGRIGHEGQQWPHGRVNLKNTVIFLAPPLPIALLLADITFMPHNPTLSRYRTWLGDFNLTRHISMPNRTGQYFSICVLSIRPYDKNWCSARTTEERPSYQERS